jgi:hypothetical protein
MKKNIIDIIRRGKFQNKQAENLRREIIKLDCGLVKNMIDDLNLALAP